jgi:hypothetical protein
LTHLDEQSNKNSSSKTAEVAADSDDGAGDRSAIPGLPRREDVNIADAKEALVTTRKSGDPRNIYLQSGVTAVRREMLLALRLEEDGRWEELAFCGVDVRDLLAEHTWILMRGTQSPESGNATEAMFSSRKNEWIDCATSMSDFIDGARCY